MNMGSNIKALREAAGMTQAELAKRMGVSDKTISSWEIDRTEPKMGKVEQLAEIFGCLKTDIIGGDGRRSAMASFSPEEVELIDGYRSLSHEGRAAVRAFVAFTAAGEREKESRNSTG